MTRDTGTGETEAGGGSGETAVASLITRLGLRPHGEGGWFALADSRRDESEHAERGIIHYLLASHSVSTLHMLQTHVETWKFIEGDPLALVTGMPNAWIDYVELGQGTTQSAVVPASAWQIAQPLPGPKGYSLVTCTTEPAFRPENWQAGTRSDLLALRDTPGLPPRAAEILAQPDERLLPQIKADC